MKRPFPILAALSLTLLATSGCATILGGGSNQPLTIQSSPSQAEYTITSSSGAQMGAGSVPATLNLPRKNEYQIAISLDGYQTRTLAVTRGTNGWIWGNLVFGWLVGFAVDFLTGSAYKLEPALVNVTLGEGLETVAIVRFFKGDQKLIREERLLMVPIG